MAQSDPGLNPAQKHASVPRAEEADTEFLGLTGQPASPISELQTRGGGVVIEEDDQCQHLDWGGAGWFWSI